MPPSHSPAKHKPFFTGKTLNLGSYVIYIHSSVLFIGRPPEGFFGGQMNRKSFFGQKRFFDSHGALYEDIIRCFIGNFHYGYKVDVVDQWKNQYAAECIGVADLCIGDSRNKHDEYKQNRECESLPHGFLLVG
jgi:hypothetical protein